MFREWLLKPLTALITKGFNETMHSLAEVKEAFDTYKTNVTEKLGTLNDSIADLKTQVAAGNADASKVDELFADVTTAQADLSGTVNAPIVPPADGAATGEGAAGPSSTSTEG